MSNKFVIKKNLLSIEQDAKCEERKAIIIINTIV